MKKTNTGFTGISLKKTGKYQATVRFPHNKEGKQYTFHVGTYDTVSEAVHERNKFITKLF